MNKQRKLSYWHWGSGLLILMLALPGAAADSDLDVRIAVDVSGSMKQTDPKNLRQPALRLLAGLLPNGTQAGVWLFSQNTTSLVPLSKVDANWKEKARRAAAAIHSRGLFTHIEDALIRTSSDWTTPPAPGTQRHLLLLTDGMVDISKNTEDSVNSRRQILEQQLPRLRDLGVKIHTVALSDQADHVLLRRLSQASGGWYEQVQDAGALQRVFLHLFEKVGNPDALPLKDNRFRVDATIQEVTLIVFRPEGSPATRLINPSGAEIGPENGANAGVTWHQDQGYDLLTLRAPVPGEWRVRAAADPDNRVLILTDLRMEVSPVPNRLLGGERLPLEVKFLDQGKPMTRQELMDILQLNAEQIGPGNVRGGPGALHDDGKDGDTIAYDGKFQTQFTPSGESGRGELVVSAQGKTFQREKRSAFELTWPAQALLLPIVDTHRLQVRVTPEADALVAGSLEPTAELIAAPPATPLPLKLSAAANGKFEGELDLTSFTGIATVQVHIQARTLAGGMLDSNLPPLLVQGQLPPLTAHPVSATAAAAPTPPENAAAEPEAVGISSIAMVIWLVVAHIVILGCGGLGYWWWRRRQQNAPDPLNLVDEETANPVNANPVNANTVSGENLAS